MMDVALHAGSLPPVTEAGEIVDWLCWRIAAVLGLDAARIDVDLPFERYGLNSVQAVEVTGDLAARTGLRDLSPTLLYDYPTINQLAAHVAGLAQRA